MIDLDAVTSGSRLALSRLLSEVENGTSAGKDALDRLFVRSGRAHLVVRLESDRAVVGPLVVPGRTPCVRCLDLTRCHLDADWPRLLAQLCLEATAPEPSLVTWAAATAMAQVRAWTAGRMPETGGGSLELALPNYLLTARRWPAHPRCGCLQPLG